jgi:glycosyltransferase involved in cell wall biosynthesis
MRGESNALKPRNMLVNWLHGCLFRQVDGFLVIGRANRALYQGHEIAGSRLFDAPYFVDNERFAGEAAAWRGRRGEVRAWLGVPDGTICFLFVGKFEAKKHPQHLIASLGRLRQNRPDLRVHGLFVGDGAMAEQLRALASTENVSTAFAGFVNQREIPKVYIAADALVLPSDYDETWGLVVNEAMACGLPALVSDRVGCGPDLVETGATGARYSFGDIEAMATVMEEWAETPGRLRHLGVAAEERVRAQYTVERSVKAVLEAVRATTEERARTAIP